MLHSESAQKYGPEDRKTSSVFENLLLLPDNVFWHIFRTSCLFSDGMKSNSGRLLNYAFWCHWDSNGTKNSNFVEPDLFLRFEEFDVIIEAKYNDINGQYSNQWERELKGYYNEYGKDKKSVFFIAVGGNATLNKEKIIVDGQEQSIFKCSWLSLLVNVNKYRNELRKITVCDMQTSATLRLLDTIILSFSINGVYNIDWFGSMDYSKPIINSKSIISIKQYYNYE